MHHLFARRVEMMKSSELGELLRLAERPDVISFAGGLPDAGLFPVEQIATVRERVIREQAKEALQYSSTEGYLPLREQIASRMNRLQGTSVTAQHVLITNGSQQGLDLTGKLFLNEGDVVLCESPTYMGALSALRVYRPKFLEVETDEEGIKLEHLDELLKAHPVKLIYVNPSFQNPTGRCWSRERRRAFMERVQQTDVIVVEDDAYGELAFDGERWPTLYSMDQKGCVIYLGTFSKIFCPGYRTGWLVAGSPWMEKFVSAKQAADMHASTINQREISLFLDMYSIDEHIERARKVYRERRDAMVAALKELMPEDVRFTQPQGGLFLWVELAEGENTGHLLAQCMSRKVAFIPGAAFYPYGGHDHTLRLSFSVTDETQIREGIRRLAEVIKQERGTGSFLAALK